MGFIKQLFCNHVSTRCLSGFDMKYVDDIFNNKKVKTKLNWQCERCGKIIPKKFTEKPSTINWEHTTIKE